MVRRTRGLKLRAGVDVAVLGAGPAGSVAALELGRAGLSVALIDPGVVQHSHQIESFPAAGAPLADAIGVLAPICRTAEGPAQRMQMYWREQPETQQFNDAGPLLLYRRELHQTLRAEALSASADTVYIKARVRQLISHDGTETVATTHGDIQARLVLDARGRIGGRRIGAQTVPDWNVSDGLVALPFSGTQQTPSSSHMLIEALPEAWVWAACLASGAVHGAIFQQASALAGVTLASRAASAERRLSKSRALPDLANVGFSRPQSAEFAAVPDPVLSDTRLVIGDAALARDPIASHGLVHALRTAVQAAAVVRTVLDPQLDSEAAYAFIRHKHRDAMKNARLATAQAYADQSLFDTPFWHRVAALPSAPEPAAISPSEPLRLSSPLTRAPVLDSGTIRWAPAITLPVIDDFIIMHGAISAVDIAACCQPPASLPELAARLARWHDQASVMAVLEHLIRGGALTHGPTSQGAQVISD